MSRIDQALQRAEGAEALPPGSGARPSEGNRDTFLPAWGFQKNAPDDVLQPARSETGDGLLGPEQSAVMDDLTSRWQERLAVSVSPDWMLVEQFRRLAANLHQTQTSSNIKTVMITSASPGDGKTLTAINLALVLSESYRRRVLLIDADLRRPSIRNVGSTGDECGLSEGLKARNERKLTVLRVTDTLALLPGGRPDPDPMSSLTSVRMHRILQEASDRFDWVVLDTPPVGTLADSSLLGAMVDGALFVVRAGHTQSPAVLKAIEALGRERIIGVVLNGVDSSDRAAYRTYEYRAYQQKGDQ